MRAIAKLFLILLVTVCTCLWMPSAIAQGVDDINQTEIPTGYQVRGADFANFSFNDLGPVEGGGSITDIIQLGDIAADFGAERITLDQIGTVLGEDLGQRSLAEFEPLTTQSLSSLSETVSSLDEFAVEAIPPVDALLQDATGIEFGGMELGGVLAENPELGELTLEGLEGLEAFTIGDFPNAETVRLDQLDGWEHAALSDIPGLADLPFNQFPAGIGLLGGATARIDFIYSPAETDRTNTISGSFQAGFAVPCPDGGQLTQFPSPYQAPEANDPPECAYLELDDLENEGRAVQSDFEGKQWISGKYQEVAGGFGPLKYTPSPLGYSVGYEPTGRHPFGSAFKVVVWEPDEREDTVSFKLFFRKCTTLSGVGYTCTPFNQFSAPFLSHKINDVIFIGALDGSGGSSSAPGGGYSATAFGVPGVPPAYGPCSGQVIDGINTDALAEAIALIESQGSGGYEAIGVYLCTKYNCGRGLGRYQTMSYLPEVTKRVQAKPGGAEWLARIESGYQPTPAELMQYYPPEDQEAAYQEELGQLLEMASGEIDPTTGQPFQGGRLIERVAQMWFGGPYSAIDGGGSDALGQLSLYDYGVEARQNYLAQGGQPSSQCAAIGAGPAGTANGNFINPVGGGYPITSPFGPRNIGCQRSKFHPAVDLGTPIGTPVMASDGGVVQFAGNVSGYGYTVVVDHGNGTKTRYSHLDSIGVRQGQAVGQGEQIALSGNSDGNTNVSTGPHLDFGIYLNDSTGPGQLVNKGNAVDPQQYIDF
ncbi:MAG: M23 family metallopeptidase [Cyanobacteria bacterium P01_D01_bin.115]